MPMPPKANPVRRNARVGPVVLPAEGRTGEIPAWPLLMVSPTEMDLWRELWRTPQAVMWERFGWTRVVARYTRYVIAAEALDKDAMSEARQLEDRLGLSPKAMRLLLWTVATDEVAEKRAESAPADPAQSARGRIKAVG